MIDDETIITLSPELLFSREIFDEIYNEDDELERERLLGMYKARAKALNLEKELSTVIKAYNKADKALASEYKRENAKRNSKISLDFDGNGKPLSTVDNFVQVLENDPKFSGIRFNLLTYSPEKTVDGEAVRWTDADDADTRHFIEKKYHFHNAQKCDDALRIVFRSHEYHPIKDIIDSLKWDGQSRICDFLHKWTKCEDSPYTREVSRLIFAGGINRLYNSGCKFDDMPVLIGTKQGEGKSTLVRWLAMKDDYFTEVTEIEGQKGMEAVEGAWICEMGELLAMTKAREIEAVKSYLTRLSDRYRRPFDRRVTDHKRQCIFIGTTNKEQFLTDKTGNRRFYPVKVYQSGYELFDRKDEIQEYIRQCWAEAKVLFDKGELPPYANRELIGVIRENQENAVEEDYRVGMIEKYLDEQDVVCVAQLWKHALHNDGEVRKKDSTEIGLIMDGEKDWERGERTYFSEFGRQRCWKRKKISVEQLDFEEIF